MPMPQKIIDHRQTLRPPVERRPAREERARIGVARIAEELRRRRLLAYFAVAHHDHVVGDLAHQCQVVRDEEHRHLAAAERRQITSLQQVAPAVEDAALPTDRRVLLWQQAHDRKRGDRLAAARLADERHRAPHRHVEADALDGAQAARLVDAEIDHQVAHLEQVHLSRGSSASRIASVNRLNAVTRIAIASVATVSCHHLPSKSSLPASASMLPQETVSTPTPKPRKVRITSDLMNSTT